MAEEKNQPSYVPVTPLLSVSRILILKGKQKKNDVLNALIRKIAEEEEYGSKEDLEWGIFHREELMSTGIGKHLAIPHLTLPGIEKGCLALAVCPEGIPDYPSPDSRMVKLVFMIICAKEKSVPHLRLLASIGKLFENGRLSAACLAAADPETCLEIIGRAE